LLLTQLFPHSFAYCTVPLRPSAVLSVDAKYQCKSKKDGKCDPVNPSATKEECENHVIETQVRRETTISKKTDIFKAILLVKDSPLQKLKKMERLSPLKLQLWVAAERDKDNGLLNKKRCKKFVKKTFITIKETITPTELHRSVFASKSDNGFFFDLSLNSNTLDRLHEAWASSYKTQVHQDDPNELFKNIQKIFIWKTRHIFETILLRELMDDKHSSSTLEDCTTVKPTYLSRIPKTGGESAGFGAVSVRERGAGSGVERGLVGLVLKHPNTLFFFLSFSFCIFPFSSLLFSSLLFDNIEWRGILVSWPPTPVLYESAIHFQTRRKPSQVKFRMCKGPCKQRHL